MRAPRRPGGSPCARLPLLEPACPGGGRVLGPVWSQPMGQAWVLREALGTVTGEGSCGAEIRVEKRQMVLGFPLPSDGGS